MVQCWQRRNWKLLLVSTLVFCGVSTNSRNCALAQIAPDTTLGAESSVVTPNILINNQLSDRIDSGAIRGANLFHSFSEFNVGNQQGVYFTNPVGIQNILSRVTGNNPSNIRGTLGVLGNANLFLINPNGIIFGQNASLDVNGSFVATTANGIQFENLGTFSATNPETPSSLLTINPGSLFFNQINQTASIQNNSIADAGKDLAGDDVLGLRVLDGKSLLLVGGNVSMDRGWAIASGGRIELGGLVEAGSIGIQENGKNFSLTFPDRVQRGDISLTNRAVVDVTGDSGGSIAVNARNLKILEGSQILGGIGQGLGTTGTQAGNIKVDAIGQIKLAGTNSLIFNSVRAEAVGNAGDITINTGSLEVTGGAQIDSLTRGRGNAGNITIQARDAVIFDGIDSDGFPSASFSDVEPGAIGNGGSINITARSLFLTNGGLLGVGVREASDTLLGGRGNGGTLNVNVRDALTIGKDSGVFANLGAGAIGRGGDVNIQAGNLFIRDGGEIISSTFGEGDSGKISITVLDTISLDTEGIYNNIQQRDAVGNSGGISITTASLSVINGAQINSFTRGQGNAGNITIQARDAVTFDGIDSNGNLSALYSNVLAGGVGNGGNISITAGSLSLTNGGYLNSGIREASRTFPGGQGIGGTVNINVRDALTIGKDSGVFANLGTDATGRGGDVNIQAGNLFVKDGGEIISSTLGKGDSGKISITVLDTISLDTSGIYSNVQQSNAVGNSGGISITTGSFSATNGAQINSFTRGQGNAGNITIQARNAITFDGANSDGNESSVSSTVESGAIGNGGNINITASSLSLSNGGRIQVGVNGASNTLPGGQGIGGTLNINVRDALTIGKNSGVFANLGAGAIGRGGDIKIRAGNVFVKDGGEISSTTSGKGDSGNISVTARDAIFLDAASSYISNNVQSSSAVGNAGNIDITTGVLAVKNGAQINSFTRGRGNAGNVTIQARDAVTFDGVDSDGNYSSVYSNVLAGAIGNGGNISITAGSLSLMNDGRLQFGVNGASNTRPGGQGIGGTLNINVRDALTIGKNSGVFANLGAGAIGRSGDIKVQAGNVFVKDGGEISSTTSGKGDSGNISVTVRDAIFLDAASYIYNNVQSSAVGNAGSIDITTGSLNIANRAGIVANTSGQGNGGNITVEAKDLLEILSDGNLESDVLQSARGNSGNITVKTGRLIVRDSQIGPSVLGEGNVGDFKIIATESVELSGQILKREGDTSNTGSVGYPGGLFAQIDLLGKGRGGNLTIETRRLSVSDGSKIQAATFGDGDAGNVFIRADEIDLFETEKPNFYNTGIFAGVQTDGRIEANIIDPRNGRSPVGKGGNLTIETRTLSVKDGAEVFVQTTGEGDAGKIFIRASESVNVAGVSTGTLERQRTSKITAAASERSTGNGGSLTIETPLLNVADGGFISSSSQGKGTAGDINITANVARLNNGQITAQTTSTDGGNINLNLGQYLFLRNGSQISTTAGTAQAGGNGGNITINTPFLIAFPNENNDITANAFRGTGGNVNINARGIFGIEARSQPSNQTNDITASSNLGLPGTINVNSPDNSSIQNSLTALPTNAIDTNTLIANSCIVRSQTKQQGSFIITGAGGLPNRPSEASVSNYSTGDVRNVIDEKTSRLWKKGDPIIEPQGVYRLSNGRLVMSRECR
ncbi:beta strand repeat-containing protein [Tolypothrix bouteillei VB521301_2]|uniref:Filamentous hemagglutinin N-terminal domain-containing protein n=1 Tax=Tolypothrix bouteillei VB521301 TaxID=1479485 RepID=A0A8S9TDE9_9CYAN|nr:filamentous hemagglutinin N-terminal domain-containing protein [Tolypothrix bouteillei]KAF3889333.1 filamentous hemagglutinin N-terminal domain-containing protein [Tolypothrix bouteillei VB521301]